MGGGKAFLGRGTRMFSRLTKQLVVLFRVSIVTSLYHISGYHSFSFLGSGEVTCNCIFFWDLEYICLNIFNIFAKVPYFVVRFLVNLGEFLKLISEL